MRAIKWTKELLEECRNEKGVVLGFMSKDAQEIIQQSETEHLLHFTTSGWYSISSVKGARCDYFAYRLSPSYTPPELIPKKWVDTSIRKTEDDILLYRTPLGNEKQLVTALSCISFMAYVYADGSLDILPRRLKADGPSEIPVAVRFWKD